MTNKTIETTEKRIREIKQDENPHPIELASEVNRVISNSQTYGDGINLQTGRETGTSFGSEPEQKVGMHGFASEQEELSGSRSANLSGTITSLDNLIEILVRKGIIVDNTTS